MKRWTRRSVAAGLVVLVVVLAVMSVYVWRHRKLARAAAQAPAIPVAVVNPADTATATLTWTAPTTRIDGTPLTNILGYRIVYGKAPRAYTASMGVTGADNLSATVSGLAWDQTWYFAVIAVDDVGRESAPSSEVSKFTRR